MTLQIGFSEFAEYCRHQLGQEVLLSYVDEKSANVCIVAKTMIPYLNKEISKEVSVKISDIQLVGEDLHMHFDAGMMMNIMASIIMKLLPESKIELGIVDFPNSTTIVVHLAKVETTHHVLKHLDVHTIYFNESGTIIDFTLRPY